MSEDSELDPTFIVIGCNACDAKLRVRGTLAGKVGKCPKCHSTLHIPLLPLYGDENEHEAVESPWDDTNHGYRLSTPLEHEPDIGAPMPLPAELNTPIPVQGYLDRLGQVRQVAVSPPPRLTFFSGVFEFPWYDEVWPRWIWLVIGGISISVIPVLAMGILNGASNYTGIALAFFAMPQIWLTLWTGSHAASCGVQVFEDTAAGNDHITTWPDPNWREWMLPFIQQGYVGLMIWAMAYGVGRVAGWSGLELTAGIVIAEFFLFPLCWLSVLEGNNMLMLFSPNVWRTLATKPASWMIYYFLTTLIATAWGGLMWSVCQFSLMLGMFLNGLLFGTFVLIYFRLLGRLAWSISTQHRRRRIRPNLKIQRIETPD